MLAPTRHAAALGRFSGVDALGWFSGADRLRDDDVLECVINISEGRDKAVLAGLTAAAGPVLLDVHSDPHHNRSVLTLAGLEGDVEEAARSVAEAAVGSLDIASHRGAHPRIGVVDVVPWVNLVGLPVQDGPLAPAVAARDRFAEWAGEVLRLPCFVYGPERSLPEIRREAWLTLVPSTGPPAPDLRAGAAAVGARRVLVAYNLWLAEPDLGAARLLAASIRTAHVRSLGLRVGDQVQVSCNLIAPWTVGPEAVFDAVASRVAVARAELVGLVPRTVLEGAPRHRWAELGLVPSSTIEARREQGGLDGGRFGGFGHQRPPGH
ncbi:MAG: hypothetical protein ACRDYY_01775 [Acidimicrobiales bacterium]